MGHTNMRVHIFGKNHMRVRIEGQQQRDGCSHSRRVNESTLAALQEAEGLFKTVLCGILIANVRIAMQLFARWAVLERGREVDRRADRSSHWVRISRRMDSKSFDLHKPLTPERRSDEDASRSTSQQV